MCTQVECQCLKMINVAVMAGVRSLEIDIFPDPNGGTYDQSVVLRLAGVNGWMNDSALQQPGFKVSSIFKMLCMQACMHSACAQHLTLQQKSRLCTLSNCQDLQQLSMKKLPMLLPYVLMLCRHALLPQFACLSMTAEDPAGSIF